MGKSRFMLTIMVFAVLLAAGCGPKGPDAPGNIRSLSDDASVWVSWTPSSGATHYLVYRSQTSGSGYVLAGTTAKTSLEVTSLTNGTTYYFVVKAADAENESAYSVEASATPVAADVKDNFESYTGSLPSPWDQVVGTDAFSVSTDSVSSSKAAYLEYGTTLYVHTGASHDDLTVSVMARGNNALTNTILQVIVRCSATAPPASYYTFSVNRTSGQAEFGKIVAGSGTPLSSADLPSGFDFSVYHVLRLSVHGSTLTGYIDGQQVLTASDTAIIAAGMAGFSIFNGMAYFDNFKVFYE